MHRIFLLLPVLAGSLLIAQRNAEERAAWNQPIQPFHIIGNIYYVGVQGVSAFLITTGKGAILLDGGFPESAPLIEKNIAELGFRVQDVKILLNSHAHYDHCGGLGELKSHSGAGLVVSERDTIVLNGRRVIHCVDPERPLPQVGVDRGISDQETVKLGGAVLTAHLTPGHTKGCTTWTMETSSGGKTYQVVFYCSTTVAGSPLVGNREYPEIAADFERTFEKLRRLPCDVFLAPHGSFFRRDEKLAAMRSGRRDAFVDPAEMRKYVDQSEQAFRAARQSN